MSTVTPYTIPLANEQQQLQISLGGTLYTLTVWWNDSAQCWTIDIGDISNNPIVTGIALVTGCDLLGQYGYLNFGGSLVCQSSFDPDTVPTYDSLGGTGQLYFVVVGP